MCFHCVFNLPNRRIYVDVTLSAKKELLHMSISLTHPTKKNPQKSMLHEDSTEYGM